MEIALTQRRKRAGGQGGTVGGGLGRPAPGVYRTGVAPESRANVGRTPQTCSRSRTVDPTSSGRPIHHVPALFVDTRQLQQYAGVSPHSRTSRSVRQSSTPRPPDNSARIAPPSGVSSGPRRMAGPPAGAWSAPGHQFPLPSMYLPQTRESRTGTTRGGADVPLQRSTRSACVGGLSVGEPRRMMRSEVPGASLRSFVEGMVVLSGQKSAPACG
jgi:hypothetical protein